MGEGHSAHEPRAVTARPWERKRKCPKAVVPRHLQHHVVWLRTLECRVKSYVTVRALNRVLIQWVYVCAHMISRINQRSWAFGMPWSPSFASGLPPRGGLWKQSKWHWHVIHRIPRRNPCRLHIHLAFTYSLRWSLKRSVRRTWTGPAFSTVESAWSVMVMGFQSHVRSRPNILPSIRVVLEWYCWNSDSCI